MKDRLIELITEIDTKCGEMGLCEDCPAYGKGASCINYYIAEHLLANGVTVQEWISVKNRLPEKWQNVLAVRSDGKMRFDFICSTGCWYEDVNYVGYSVTHWMPLPQPPKGE